MKKFLSSILFLCMAIAIYAETEPAISVTAEVSDEERSLSFGASEKGVRLKIDWGDGNLVETDEIATNEDYPSTTTVTGTPKGEGIIKIYGDNIVIFECPSTVSGPKIKSIDITNATKLKELTVNTNAIENLDISKNTELESLVCYANPIEVLDISNNPKLENIDAKDLQISEIDISKCPLLRTLYLNNNSKITSLDISKNENLENLYLIGASLTEIDLSKATKLKALSMNNNKLTKLDASACTQIATLFCIGNNISELIIPENIKTTLNCTGNRLNFATLPVSNARNYLYAPQQEIKLESIIKPGTEINLAYLDNIKGMAETVQKTTFVWKTQDGSKILEEGIDYNVTEGIFTFLKEQENIFCEMTTPAFPKFSDKNTLKTSVIDISNRVNIITIKAEVTDEERSMSFVASEKGIRLGIDWGDGVIVETDEIATSENEPYITTITGTPKGDGTIKIYGDKITVFECPSTTTGAKIKSIDITKATGLKELTVNTNAIEVLDLSKNVELESLVCYGNPIETLDISNNTKLDNIDAKDLQLSEFDISKCPLLKTLYLNNNSKITTLDISRNENLENLYLIGTSLTEIDLSKATKLKALSMNNNKLTRLDASACTQIATLFCLGNNISELIIPENIKTTLNCSGNRLHFATLPVTNAKNFIYAPQQNIELESEINTGTELDFSYLDNIKGLGETTQKTTFVWKSEDGLTILEEGVDYKVEDGIFTFLKKQEKIYCEMSTPAFPKFSDKNALKTSVINVEEGTSISMTDKDMITVYTNNGKIIIDNPTDNKHISVYKPDGTMVVKTNSKEQTTEINVEKGVYLVTVNGRTYKVINL